MNLDNLTLGQLKEIKSLINSDCSTDKANPYKIGEKYFIRTVTHYFTGRLIEIYARELVLEEAAWIADTGRFSDALKSGIFSEIEPIDNHLIVGRDAIIDCVRWDHELPRIKK
jgi:hypothetical protein